MRRLVLAAGLLTSFCIHAPLQAASTVEPTSGVRAEQPWARATAPRQTVGGAYVTLTSPVDDRLMGASSPLGRTEVHEMTMEGAVMRMREQKDGIALPAGKPVTLAPGGYHIMLMDLQKPLVVGQVIAIQLRFQHAPPIDLQVKVAPIGAQAPSMEHAH